MSYDIYIGNAVFDEIDEDDTSYRVRVNRVNLSNAPTFPGDEMTGNGNSRHPGYSAWSEFCRKAGLNSLFFDKEEGLMHSHPGNAVLRKEHAEAIEQALTKWRNGHPDSKPGFDSFNGEYPDGLYDAILARLIWLDFWVKWALDNCERPAIWNF